MKLKMMRNKSRRANDSINSDMAKGASQASIQTVVKRKDPDDEYRIIHRGEHCIYTTGLKDL